MSNYQPLFVDTKEAAKIAAKMFLEINAVHFNAHKPFVLTSGKKSPVYIDCRKLISYPRLRSTLMDLAVAKIVTDFGFERFDAIAGGETAGIPFASFIAERMNLPLNYVRKKPKGFGRDAQIEGSPIVDKDVILIEDLATDGGSKLHFIDAMRTAGATADACFVIFYYDIFEGALQDLQKHNIKLSWLTTWWHVLEVAKEQNVLDSKTISSVEEFLHNPKAWQNKNA